MPVISCDCRQYLRARRFGLGLACCVLGLSSLVAGESVVDSPALEPGVSVGEQGVPVCRELDGREIACLSARHWIPADILRQRGRTVTQLFCEEDACSREAAQALAYFLRLQAQHEEDLGAASALRAYYTRIALREQLELTDESMQLIDSETDKQRAAQEGGLPAGTDRSAFERHRIEILDNRVQIVSKDRQLRCLLSELTRIDYAMSDVCLERLEVFETELNNEILKQQALEARQDLRGWIYLSRNVNEESAPVFAKMLGTLVGGWGLPIPTVSALKGLLCPPDYSGLAANMQRELQLAVETQRRWICQAVEEKCEALEEAYERRRLALSLVGSWRDRLTQLTELDRMGEARTAELAVARSELLRARADEIRRRLDARLAEIQLAEVVGGLSIRCCAGQAWLRTGNE